MTRHRVPEAPARRKSMPRRRHSAVEAGGPSFVADALVADVLTVKAPLPAEHDDRDDDGAAVVVQDAPTPEDATAPKTRNRRIGMTAVAAVCVTVLAAGLIHASAGQGGILDVDNTGFGVLLGDGPANPEQIPNSLLNPDAGKPAGGQQQQAPAAGLTNGSGLGDAVAQGVTALFGGANSPWSQRIAAGAAIDSSSSAVVNELSSLKFQMSYKQWTVPIYYADASTPRHDVPLTGGYDEEGQLRDVPIPANAEPDPSEDAHISIVDRSKGCVYDFWGASGKGSGLSAKIGNAIPLDSSGVYPGGLGSRASGFSAAAGVVTAAELKAGVINHALVFAAPNTKSGGPVSPASKSDGQSGGSGALPEGARVRLNPSINLNSLGLNRYELIIARAMQQYGMILGDTSGGFTIYAQNPQSASFGGTLPDDTWVDLTKIPTDELQVLKLPAQKSPELGTVGNRCNGF